MNDIEITAPQIEIVHSKQSHVRLLTENIRKRDVEEILAIGFTPHRAIMKSYKSSIFPQTAFIDGEIAAMWGVVANPLSDTGRPWLLTTDTVYKISPLRFARIYQKEVKRMLRVFSHLENYVDSGYNEAVRLLDIVGFQIEPAEPYGSKGALFHRFWKNS